MKVLKNILNWFILTITFSGVFADEAVDNNICDFGGQGRNKYGK